MHDVVIDIHPAYQDRYRPWRQAAEQLKTAGYNLIFFPENPDVIGDINVAQLDGLLKNPARFERIIGRNLIIYERTGCAPVASSGEARKWLAMPELKAWIKDITFRDPTFYNKPMVYNRWHLTYCPKLDGSLSAPSQATPLSPTNFHKITSVLPIYMYPRMDPLLDQKTAPISARRIDCFFAGNMDFEQEQIVAHRRAATEAILRTNRRSAIFTANVLKGNGYVEMMRQAKILVSPYGSGGYSWKDFEAMYMGLVLIKPENEFSKTYGFDLFDGEKHLVKCKPDYSDLSEKVALVLDNQAEYDEKTRLNRIAIDAARSVDMVARDLKSLFDKALAQPPAA